jgi:solute carrier family 25 (peroxisomal adenine nucleotide transporter), member 17
MSSANPIVPIQPITHAIGGAMGSAAALLAFYPLERARIELQTQAAEHKCERSIAVNVTKLPPDSERNGRSTFNRTAKSAGALSIPSTREPTLKECLFRLWQSSELYKGLSPIVCTLTISNFVFFYFHNVMRQLVASGRQSTNVTSLIASCLAGVVNVLLTNPLWVANLRIVTSQDRSSSSLWKEMVKIAKEEGNGALWQGTWTSMLLVSNPVIQFYAYEQLKTSLLATRGRKKSSNDATLRPLEAFLAGALSKTLATLCTYPLQLAQSILRSQSNNSDGSGSPRQHYKSTWDCLLRLYFHGGLAKCFTGMKAKLLQTALTAAFTFLTYEQILHAVHRAQLTLLQRNRITSHS